LWYTTYYIIILFEQRKQSTTDLSWRMLNSANRDCEGVTVTFHDEGNHVDQMNNSKCHVNVRNSNNYNQLP